MKCIIHIMVVCSTAGGNDEQRAREGNDGRVSWRYIQGGIPCNISDNTSCFRFYS